MNEREKLLRRVVLKCVDLARQLSYHRAFDDYKNFKLNFWIYMFNNAIDLAVSDWVHLFGSDKDDLHWKQVMRKDIDGFRQGLLQYVGKNKNEWQMYRNSIKNYRDKDVAHIEVRSRSNVPEMTIALQAAAYYYAYVLNELTDYAGYDTPSLAGSANYSKLPKDLTEFYKSNLEQTKKIVTIAYGATKNMKDAVL